MKLPFFDSEKRDPRAPRALLVEGSDDGIFFNELLSEIQADPNMVQILAFGGKDHLDSSLSLFIKSAAFASQAIVRYALVIDADENVANSIRDVHAVLTRHHEPLPAHSQFINATNPYPHDVGLYILPSDQRTGDLDLVCLETVPNDPVLNCVDQFMACIPNRLHDQPRFHKRRVQVYLAAKPEISRGPGMGFRDRYFDRNHLTLEPIKQFLTALIQ